MNKGELTGEDLVFVTPAGEVVEGERAPTGELPMYLRFFRDRPDVRSVLHCHPPAAGAFAVTAGENLLMRPVFPETVTEVGPVPVVPYGQPLTERLAANFEPFLQRYNAFLMENHGLVLLTQRGIDWAMMMTELLEMTAGTILDAARLGPMKEIGRDEVAELDEIMSIRGLPMHGAPGANSSLVELYFGT
jgi:L-fuculose-phosphate aldolase